MGKMKITSKTIISLLLTLVMLTSCNSFVPTLKTQPTKVMETALAIVGTAMAETQTAIPTATSTAILLPPSPLPPTETPIPTSALSFSGTPTIIPVGDGLSWSECVVPYRDYSREAADMEFLDSCIKSPVGNKDDKKRSGEFIDHQNATNDWRMTIGNDYFETRINDLSKGCCSYKLVKNGDVILEMSPGFMTSNPNRGFWNIGGKLVWELGGYISVIVVDGVDFNENYQLEGSYFPYEIKGKLIYIAKQNGKFHIVYDNKVMGPEFDAIQMAYCCGMASVYYGSGQYWFLGRRGGTKYVVSIR
jgi:hypothetical protein